MNVLVLQWKGLRLSIRILIAFGVADAALTVFATSLGATELNPLGVVGGIAAKLVGIVAVIVLDRLAKADPVANRVAGVAWWVAAGYYAALVALGLYGVFVLFS